MAKKASAIYFDPVTDPKAVSMTKQSFREEADINVIMKRAERTGVIGDPLAVYDKGVYGDFSDGADFLTIQNRVLAMNEYFMTLPGEVRAKFNHDPAVMIDFVSNPANLAESVKLGLVSKDKIPQPVMSDKTAVLEPKVDKPADPPAAGGN